ncbi:MAG TPA: hypothetical protein VG456_06030 [Candidatus Sulfopaludibacter sp.]|jgi:hypothetical protein|nr:hypothetical protein [Candidatus Sulfopaludibacter sp.]
MRNTQVDQLAKQAAELALRLSALSADDLRDDPAVLDSLEILATRVIKEVSALRVGKVRPIGETCGLWPAMQPLRR